MSVEGKTFEHFPSLITILGNSCWYQTQLGIRYGDRGYFVQPTVFGDVSDDMRICQEEIFGPVQAIQKVKNMDDAIARANK